MEYATTQQVADFYGVDMESVRQIAKRNKAELEEDGYYTAPGKEIKEKLDSDKLSLSHIEPKLGHFIVHHKGQQTKITYRNVALFPKRAILRVGMLLRDSEVAKEVRTQLLNIEEKTNKQIKVVDINEELILQTNIVKAFAKGVRTQLLNIEENATKEDD